MQYSGNATPIEEISFADTNQKARAIHSKIDTGIFGSVEQTVDTTITNTRYYYLQPTASLVTITSGTITNDGQTGETKPTTGKFLFVKVKSCTGTPNVQLSFATGDTVVANLTKVGDFLCLPLLSSTSLSNVKIKETQAATITTIVEVMIAGA